MIERKEFYEETIKYAILGESHLNKFLDKYRIRGKITIPIQSTDVFFICVKTMIVPFDIILDYEQTLHTKDCDRKRPEPAENQSISLNDYWQVYRLDQIYLNPPDQLMISRHIREIRANLVKGKIDIICPGPNIDAAEPISEIKRILKRDKLPKLCFLRARADFSVCSNPVGYLQKTWGCARQIYDYVILCDHNLHPRAEKTKRKTTAELVKINEPERRHKRWRKSIIPKRRPNY